MCPECGREFRGARGVAIHTRRAHPEVYHAKQTAVIGAAVAAQVKRRWAREETADMARQEAWLCDQGTEARKLNTKLVEYMTHRTLNAIKGQRRTAEYKAMVESYRSGGIIGGETLGTPPARDSDSRGVHACLAPVIPIRDRPVEAGHSCPIIHDTPIPATTDCDRTDYDERAESRVGEAYWRRPVIETILEQAELANILPELLEYVTCGEDINPRHVQELIDRDLLGLLPPVESNDRRNQRPPPPQEARTARAQRRRDYAKTQSLFRKSRSGCARAVLAGHWSGETPSIEMSCQVAFWKPLFETPSTIDDRSPPGDSESVWGMASPVTLEEVKKHLQGMKNGAPGPDSRRKKDLETLRVEALTCRFNIWLLACVAPESFRHGVTVLIPKSGESAAPAQFRPITMGSVMCRLYHRILADRIENAYRISERQKAFRKGDGIADNTHILRCVLSDRQTRCQSTGLAFLDVSKAFDSVSHDSIFLAAATAGIPPPIVEYVRSLYAGCRTQLRVGGQLSEEIRIARGVRQGDPLSPVLFNTVIDLCLRHIDSNIGVSVGDQTLSCLAFADDLVLFSKTPTGLQRQFTIVESALDKCGLAINARKCSSIRLDVHGKRKIWACNPHDFVRSRNGDLIKALSIVDGYRYLGNLVCAGTASDTTVCKLRDGIGQLTRAPLKPQQRMFILRCNLLPSLLHTAVLGRMSKHTLDFIDKMSRAAVRGWLRLPKDTPNSFIHADSKDGGLAVPKLILIIPLLRIRRVSRMASSSDPVVRGITELSAFKKDFRRWCKPLSVHGIPIRDGLGIVRAMGHSLHSSVDGLGLAGCRDAGWVNSWMVNGSALLTGRGYIGCIQLKGGLVHTALRASRGRPEASPKCDACSATESIGHILQVCQRTHEARVSRHDGVNKLLNGTLIKRGFTTIVEPPIPTPAGLRYPDIVAYRGGTCVVVDTTIIGDTFDLNAAHVRKQKHYDTPAIREWCAIRSGVLPEDILFSACVLNWRGTPANKSVRELSDIAGITFSDWTLMSLRTIEGGTRTLGLFRRTTSRYPSRIMTVG